MIRPAAPPRLFLTITLAGMPPAGLKLHLHSLPISPRRPDSRGGPTHISSAVPATSWTLDKGSQLARY